MLYYYYYTFIVCYNNNNNNNNCFTFISYYYYFVVIIIIIICLQSEHLSSGFMEFQYLIKHSSGINGHSYVRQPFTLLLYWSAYATKSYSLIEFWKVYCDLLVRQSVRLGFQSDRNSLFLLTFYVLLVMLTRRHNKRKENFVELWHFIVYINKYMHPWNVENMVAGNHVKSIC